MSHQATRWALSQRGLKPATKVVLFYLCDHHNPELGCFPEQKTLAAECEMSRSALNVHLNTLEEMGLLRRISSIDERTKRQRPTRYILAFEDGSRVHNNDTGRVRNADDSVSENKTRAVSGFDEKPCPDFAESRVQNPDTNPVREPLTQPVKAARAEDRIVKLRADLIASLGMTGSELSTSGTFIVGGMGIHDLPMRLAIWDKHGLTDEQIVMAVAAAAGRMREKDPQWKPRSIKYFDAAVADFATNLKAGKGEQPRQKPTYTNPQHAERDAQIRAEFAALKGKDDDASKARRQDLIRQLNDLKKDAA